MHEPGRMHPSQRGRGRGTDRPDFAFRQRAVLMQHVGQRAGRLVERQPTGLDIVQRHYPATAQSLEVPSFPGRSLRRRAVLQVHLSVVAHEF